MTPKDLKICRKEVEYLRVSHKVGAASWMERLIAEVERLQVFEALANSHQPHPNSIAGRVKKIKEQP